MKNLLFPIITFLAFSCTQPEADHAEAEESVDPNLETFEANIKTLRQVFDAFIAKDLEAMRANGLHHQL